MGYRAFGMSAAAAEPDRRRQLKHVTDLVRTLPSIAATEEVLREVANAVASVRTDGACAIHLLEEATGAWYAVPGACHADLVAPAVTRHPDGRWHAEWSPHLDARAGFFAVAVTARDVLFGVVLLRFDPAAPLADDEREVVELLAAEAALALHMRRLHENARRQQREAEELAWVARTLNETLDVTEVGRRVVDSVLLLFGATFSRLRTLAPDGALTVLAWAGGPPEPWEPAGALVSSDLLEDPQLALATEAREGLADSSERAVLGVPLRAKGVPIGVLAVGDYTGRVWKEAEVALMRAFADQAALALENARLFAAERSARAAAEATEEQLRQAQKMEAVGLLAGGIAHDFNNLLTIISGRAQMLIDRPLPAEAASNVAIIRATTDRAAVLVRQLLAIGRRQILRPKVVDLNEVVRAVASLLRRVIGEDVELVLDLTSVVSPVLADPGQLEQVLMNLAINARDAMPRGGRLTIGSAEVVVDEALAALHLGAARGPHVRLTIADVGQGMDEATRARAFEPFFTTKPVGKGTGLGLSTVHGIVRQSGGFLDLDSRVGAGTTFRIYLPRATGPVETVGASPRASAVVTRGTETVLVAEDDDDVRAIACQILASNGYTVLEAADVEDALRLAEEHRGPIHLLLSDVVMPRMSGPELVDRVRQRRPEVAVLYVSGYTDDPRIAERPGAGFLQKPFSVADLVRAVRERLDRREG